MYISYQQQKGRVYGRLCKSVRRDGKILKEYGGQLGLAVDKKRHVFFNRDMGLFQYDLEKNECCCAPKDVKVPVFRMLKVPARPITFTFGDVYLIEQFVRKIELREILDEAYADNADSLQALLCFYMVSRLNNNYAYEWLEKSYARFLFPKAALSSSEVSRLLIYIGEPSRQQDFFRKYLQWFSNKYQKDSVNNVLIDSTGLPNDVHLPLTAISTHNGETNNEVRLIYVVQRTTGIPIYFRCVPGNIIDINTITRTIDEVKLLGVKIDHTIMDAGYVSEENIEELCLNNIIFLSRLQPNRIIYKNVISKYGSQILTKGTMVKQGSRIVWVLKVSCLIRPENKKTDDKGRPGYAFICLDDKRQAQEKMKAADDVLAGKITPSKYSEIRENGGKFVLISNKDIEESDVVELYYTRQEVEQAFDFAKNYARTTPISVQKIETFRGHMVISFLATIVIKLLFRALSSTKTPVRPTLDLLAQHTCTKFGEDGFVTDEPRKKAKDAYRAAGVDYPAFLPMCSQQS